MFSTTGLGVAKLWRKSSPSILWNSFPMLWCDGDHKDSTLWTMNVGASANVGGAKGGKQKQSQAAADLVVSEGITRLQMFTCTCNNLAKYSDE